MVDLRRRAGRLVRRARHLVLGAGPTAVVGGAEPVTLPPAPRFDRLPDLAPFPEARYAFLVGAIPRNYGGRTASVLNKCRLLKEIGGVDSTIITLNYSAGNARLAEDLRLRGKLADGVSILNLYDFLEGPPAGEVEGLTHPVDLPGLEKIRDLRQEVYRYFENGVYRRYRRYDDGGRLLLQDWFNENRARTRRDEFRPDGTVRRTTYMDLHHNRPRQEVYFRPDGSPFLNKWLRVDPETLTSHVERVTLMDERGRPTKVLLSHVQFVQHVLKQMLGDGHVFLTVESRRADTETLTLDQPDVKQVCVLHNPHLVTPGDDLSQVRGSYLPMFERRDRLASIVFLTNAQRADAEAHFGENANFRVIPHPGYRFAPTPFEERDPDLVVMLARLDQQKRLWHAIDVFHRVHKVRPQARLEIYGHGPDRATLQAQIDRLGLRGVVTLPGFTRDPAGVYRRASLSMLTSKYEGFPLFLLETMAHGCPVVSYDVKYGPSEIISDGVDGYLVPSGDKAAMARRVVELLADPVQRRQMSERAAQPHDELSEEAFVARWSGLFRELDAAGWD